MLLKVVLCSLKPPLRVLGACFVICNCFCHINYKAGVKITTAGRIITRQTPHSGLSVHHLQILHECADFTRLLKIIRLRLREGFRSDGKCFMLRCFLSLNKGVLHMHSYSAARTNNGLTYLTVCNPTRWTSIHTDQYPQHNGRMLSYAPPRWPVAGDTH